MKSYRLLFIFLFISLNLFSQHKRFEKKLFVDGADTMPYRILLPPDYKPAKKYPIVFFLHGLGERGNDNESQLIHGSKLFEESGKRFPAIVVFPQCASNTYWSSVLIKNGLSFDANRPPTPAMKLLELLIPQVIKNYPVNENKVFIGGLSMGAMGVFELVSRQPKIFAAAFAICGGGDTAVANRMTQPGWWIFHGAKDNVVMPEYSQQMAAALTKAGAKVKLNIYPDANHGSWNNAFAEPDLLPWLFSHYKL